jgi:hypothetical protein
MALSRFPIILGNRCTVSRATALHVWSDRPLRRPTDPASSACVPSADWSKGLPPATPSPCRTVYAHSRARILVQSQFQVAFHEAASRIRARLILRAASLPPLSDAVSSARSVSFRSPRYRMLIADLPASRATKNRIAGSRPDFTPQAGPVSGVYSRLYACERAPIGGNGHHAVLPATPPSVHQMVFNLEKAGMISRQPGALRSIVVLLDRAASPS